MFIYVFFLKKKKQKKKKNGGRDQIVDNFKFLLSPYAMENHWWFFKKERGTLVALC